jgi:hypothetical protein
MATGRVPTTANSPLTAKGDLFGYSTTQARVAVGNDGETLVADSSTSTGLRYQGNYSAGKNKIINGDCGIWQRGNSFTFNATGGYTADRFEFTAGGGGVLTVTREAFTPGTAPVSGYEGTYYINANYTTSGTSSSDNGQYIEDVRTFAGQTVTMSVWVKVSTGTHTLTPQLVQRFGSGGSSAGATSGTAFTATTSWQRYSATVTLPSVSGKTIGAGSSLQFRLDLGTTGVKQFSYWGWQVEAGSVATAFQTATGTLQGELAACQRYYFQDAAAVLNAQQAVAATTVYGVYYLPVVMRANPTLTQTGASIAASNTAATTFTYDASAASPNKVAFYVTGGASTGQVYLYRPIQVSAEL